MHPENPWKPPSLSILETGFWPKTSLIFYKCLNYSMNTLKCTTKTQSIDCKGRQNNNRQDTDSFIPSAFLLLSCATSHGLCMSLHVMSLKMPWDFCLKYCASPVNCTFKLNYLHVFLSGEIWAKKLFLNKIWSALNCWLIELHTFFCLLSDELSTSNGWSIASSYHKGSKFSSIGY